MSSIAQEAMAFCGRGGDRISPLHFGGGRVFKFLCRKPTSEPTPKSGIDRGEPRNPGVLEHASETFPFPFPMCLVLPGSMRVLKFLISLIRISKSLFNGEPTIGRGEKLHTV